MQAWLLQKPLAPQPPPKATTVAATAKPPRVGRTRLSTVPPVAARVDQVAVVLAFNGPERIAGEPAGLALYAAVSLTIRLATSILIPAAR
jgi:hypothetical protein